MSITPTIKSTRPRKMTYAEIAQVQLRLRRRLEDSLSETPRQNAAERRFIQAMIDLLYCIHKFDRGSETIIDSVRKITQVGQLRYILSRSTTEWSPTHELIVRVPSPSEHI
jgi:hypothetical protein